MNEYDGNATPQQPNIDDTQGQQDGTTPTPAQGQNPGFNPGQTTAQQPSNPPYGAYRPAGQQTYGPAGQPYSPNHPYNPGQPYGNGQSYGPGQQFPPQGVYYAPAPNDQWNVLCIVGFVLAFIIPPVGLVLSIIALVQINRTHEKSKGLSIAGIVVGAFETLLGILLIILVIWGLGFALNNHDSWSNIDSSCTSAGCSLQSQSTVSDPVVLSR